MKPLYSVVIGAALALSCTPKQTDVVAPEPAMEEGPIDYSGGQYEFDQFFASVGPCEAAKGTFELEKPVSFGKYAGAKIATKHYLEIRPDGDGCTLVNTLYSVDVPGVNLSLVQTSLDDMISPTELEDKLQSKHKGIIGKTFVCTYANTTDMMRDLDNESAGHWVPYTNIKCDEDGECAHYTTTDEACFMEGDDLSLPILGEHVHFIETQ